MSPTLVKIESKLHAATGARSICPFQMPSIIYKLLLNRLPKHVNLSCTELDSGDQFEL